MAIIRNQPKKVYHAGDIEVAIAQHLDPRQNLIVPNVFWGLGFDHELDLIVVTQNNYAWEIEIKVTKSDLKADIKKSHGHYSSRIKRLYFAVPEFLKDDALALIPERAGLFIVKPEGWVSQIRPAKINTTARKLDDKEVAHLYRLLAMRVWTLKRVIYDMKRNPSKRR